MTPTIEQARAELLAIGGNVTLKLALDAWAKSEKFKAYVHQRLDDAGVPADPDPEHNAQHGCRIEGRLNWLFNALAEEKAKRKVTQESHDLAVKRAQQVEAGNESLQRDLAEEKAKREEAEKDRDHYKRDYERTCKTVITMHEVATGRKGEAPRIGVIEDIAQLRSDLEAARGALKSIQQEARMALDHRRGGMKAGTPDFVGVPISILKRLERECAGALDGKAAETTESETTSHKRDRSALRETGGERGPADEALGAPSPGVSGPGDGPPGAEERTGGPPASAQCQAPSCETRGHLWGPAERCVFCWTPRSAEPAPPQVETKSPPTHRCKVCGALWWQGYVHPVGQIWSLRSPTCGKCCDNVAMGEQIEPLPAPPQAQMKEHRCSLICQACNEKISSDDPAPVCTTCADKDCNEYERAGRDEARAQLAEANRKLEVAAKALRAFVDPVGTYDGLGDDAKRGDWLKRLLSEALEALASMRTPSAETERRYTLGEVAHAVQSACSDFGSGRCDAVGAACCSNRVIAALTKGGGAE